MKIALGTLKDKGEEMAKFLEPRVGTKPELSGDSIEIDDESVREGVKPRSVKTYIKRFLYMNGVRKNYRVFVAGKELTIQEIELSEEEEEEKKKAEKKEKAEPEKMEEPEEAKEAAKEEEPAPEAKPETPEAEPAKEPAPPEQVKEEAEEKPKPKKASTRKPRATKKKSES